jgi:hypothetical protein
MGAKLFYFQMEHAPAGTDKLFLPSEFVFSVYLLWGLLRVILPLFWYISLLSIISVGYIYLRKAKYYTCMRLHVSLFDCLSSLSFSDIVVQIY